jgi:hypothetical protein
MLLSVPSTSSGKTSQEFGRSDSMRKSILATLALTGSLLAGSSSALAATTMHQTVSQPMAGQTITNDCTGEVVTVTSGTFFMVFQTTVDQQGGIHVAQEGQAQGVTGVGSSGTRYQVTGGFWGAENTPASGGTVVTDVDNLHLLSQGSGANLLMQATEHMTVSASGTITASVDNLRVSCSGAR